VVRVFEPLLEPQAANVAAQRESNAFSERKQKARERGIALLTTTAAMFVIVPVVGLVIDAGFLYAVRARLSSATDAAAIAAARSLSKGLSMSEQEGSAVARAESFFAANFPKDA
jgi:uncharacterized membrane protein